jgi:hypothetical protein
MEITLQVLRSLQRAGTPEQQAEAHEITAHLLRHKKPEPEVVNFAREEEPPSGT